MDLVVSQEKGREQLRFGARTFHCAIGSGGKRADKHEGDGATPIGRWPLRRLFYRPDRLSLPACPLQGQALSRDDGWCDEPAHPDYNQLVKLPHPARCENMWREDGLYDLCVTLGYNDAPVVPGLGSAIFLHCAREDYGPTAGCVALERNDLLWVLAHIDLDARLVVEMDGS